MKVFTDLNELIKRLYAERKLLHALFQARLRYDFSYEEAVRLVESEKNLRLLIDYGVIRHEGNLIELEEIYQREFGVRTSQTSLKLKVHTKSGGSIRVTRFIIP